MQLLGIHVRYALRRTAFVPSRAFASNPWRTYTLNVPRLRSFSLEHSPAITNPSITYHNSSVSPEIQDAQNVSTEILAAPKSTPDSPPQSRVGLTLPTSCPSCGALSQEVNAGEAGYYSRSRKAVKHYLRSLRKEPSEKYEKQETDPSASVVSHNHDEEQTGSSQEQPTVETTSKSSTHQIIPLPICDRCHDLMYNSRGDPIAHPSIEDLADSIVESPFSRNHVYHVLDAADFPMSLIPSIHNHLTLAKPRSQNRRSKHSFPHRPTLSFLITRSDLLAPSKEMVDKMMPYFQSVLRTALGRSGRDMRLGNIHLVSAKRGWWTGDIKDSIWKRGGGNWMVGKLNVGKSNLFEVLFPKGSGERVIEYDEEKQQNDQKPVTQDDDVLPEHSMLPPSQPEMPFPTLPLVSSLPGTTASPIRIPFGNHKGELIDLPGLERGNLDEYVQKAHKLDLVMTTRPNVVQYNIKPGQSLILGGGLIRVTPVLDESDTNSTVLAYPFVPIDAHVTSTAKAIGIQQQERESGVVSILSENAGPAIASAGKFTLDCDVTKQRAGPLLRAGVSFSNLPFRVFSTDILIEGVGWVELICQVRKRRLPVRSESSTQCDDTFVPFVSHDEKISTSVNDEFPKVEIFTPNGNHIGQRKPLSAWEMLEEGKRTRSKETNGNRPRKSMKGLKKAEKLARREREA